jgi:Zn finger protein HypA/HybF involved in hydrogenase expression
MKTEMACNECGKKFKRTIKKNTYEIRCPKCHGYDTEPDYLPSFGTMKMRKTS